MTLYIYNLEVGWRSLVRILHQLLYLRRKKSPVPIRLEAGLQRRSGVGAREEFVLLPDSELRMPDFSHRMKSDSNETIRATASHSVAFAIPEL